MIVDTSSSSSKTTKEQIDWWSLRFDTALANDPVGFGLCRGDWAKTKRRTIVSVVFRTSGDEQSGDYLLIGGTGEKLSRRTLTKVSHTDARKAVLDMGFAAFGRRLRSVHAALEWAELAR